MPYRVNYRGLDVVADSLDEVDALADRLEARGRGRGVKSSAQVSPPTTIAEVVLSATTDQRKILKHLAEVGEASDEILRTVVGATDNKQLAGMTAGLSKRLIAAGLDVQLVRNEHRFENGQRVYKYWVPTEVIEDVKKGLGMEV
jgi:hypothetical protein